MSKVDSKYTLVHLAARRAREINNYYHSLGEGLGQYVRPLVEQVDSNKPLSIALEEIAAEKIVPHYPGDPRAQAEALLASDLLEADLLDPGILGGEGLGGLDAGALGGEGLESDLGGDIVPLDLDDPPK